MILKTPVGKFVVYTYPFRDHWATIITEDDVPVSKCYISFTPTLKEAGKRHLRECNDLKNWLEGKE